MKTTARDLTDKTHVLHEAQANYLNRVAPGWKQRWVNWSGGKTQVLEMGEGPVLLFLHGGLGEAFQYGTMFNHLAKRFRVMAIDRPGHGLADPINYDGVNLLDHAAVFINDILTAEGITNVTFVATSMGGLWALHYTLKYPEKVSQVILLGSPAGVTRNLPAPLRFGTLPILRNIVHKLMLKPTAESVKGFWKQMLVHDAEKLDQDFLEACAASQARNAYSWFTLIDAAMNVAGLRKYLLLGERWRSLKVPVTCLWGDEDVWAKPDLAPAIQAMTPLFKTVVIKGAGHAPWFDDLKTILREMDHILMTAPSMESVKGGT
jgi:pimeloyl-ACP methyl ester carboxylesterase